MISGRYRIPSGLTSTSIGSSGRMRIAAVSGGNDTVDSPWKDDDQSIVSSVAPAAEGEASLPLRAEVKVLEGVDRETTVGAGGSEGSRSATVGAAGMAGCGSKKPSSRGGAGLVPVLWTGTRCRGFHVETARVVVLGVGRRERRGPRARRAWERILGGGMGVEEEGGGMGGGGFGW